MRIHHDGGVMRIAMASHPEYDDRFWRYVEDLKAGAKGVSIPIEHVEDALWRLEAPAGEVTINYRIHLPPQTTPTRAAWRPFLSATGGLIGDLHSLMYLVGASANSAQVTLDIPDDWAIASGLDPTADPRTFAASSVELLLDSPIVVGHFSVWDFTIGRVPHHIVYLPQANATPFDTSAFVAGVRRLANEAIKIFGRAPYHRYTYIFEDGAGGALEHLNSVTIGAHSADLAKGLDGVFQITAHEYFHTWNLMHVRPVERVGLSYHQAKPTSVLWWSEGTTIFFSDLLLRRAQLPVAEASRIAHLENKIATYLLTPGYSRISPAQVSLLSDDPLALGDDYASIYLQGELLGAMLDLMIREATHGRRSLDDAMRTLSEQFTPQRGITDQDIEIAVHDACKCDASAFFETNVRRPHEIDFDRYLMPIGLQAKVSWNAAQNSDGTPAPDLRIFAVPMPDDQGLRLRLMNPASAWGRAGLHTGDRLLAVDGRPVKSWSDLRSWLGQLRVGQTARVEVMRNNVRSELAVPITGYARPMVKIEQTEATPEQKRLREQWLNADSAKTGDRL